MKFEIGWSVQDHLPFEVQWEYQDQREMLMVEDADGWGGGPSTGGVSRNWFGGRNFWAMSVDVYGILNWFWCRWIWRHWRRNSRSKCKEWHRQWRRNRLRYIDRNLWREIWNRLKELNISRHQIWRDYNTCILFCSRIAFYKSRRYLSNPGDKSWTK